MSTPMKSSLFTSLTVFRPNGKSSLLTTDATVHVAPEDSRVQVRFDARALRVWFLGENDETVDLEFVLRHPRIISFSETELVFEGFEATKGAEGEVHPHLVTAYLA